MYKVFYNDKAIILTDKPIEKYKSLKYVTNNQFDEALDMLKNSNNEVINIYHHNLSKLWNNFQNHFKYLEAAGGVVKNQKDKILFRSEEHTSELQSRENLVCRLLLEKKKKKYNNSEKLAYYDYID